MRVLVLGDGLLGSEIVKQTGWSCLSRKKDKFDVLDSVVPAEDYDVVVNCVANTDTYSKDGESHWNVNYKAVTKLVLTCNAHATKLVHISTDYVYANSDSNASEENTVPVHANNWYSYTKLLGDAQVQLLSDNYLLVRCSHKPNPFPFAGAWVDQIGNFDYVDRIASLIVKLIVEGASGVYNVGTELKSIRELSSITRETEPTISPSWVPKDISMNVSKMKKFFEKNDNVL